MMYSWASFYFVLQREAVGGAFFLFYYKAWVTQIVPSESSSSPSPNSATNSARPLGKVLVDGGRVAEHVKDDRGFFNFAFVTIAGQTHHMRVTSEADRDRWIASLNSALARGTGAAEKGAADKALEEGPISGDP